MRVTRSNLIRACYSARHKETDNDRFEQYKKEHKKFNAFLVSHHDELKKTRNTNEAHKGEDFNEQVLSIENLSVAHSIEVIQEGNVLLST